MKAFEVSVIGGKVRKVKIRTVGEYTVLDFCITKMRKRRDAEQFTTYYCSYFNPKDWMLSAINDGATVVVSGETWEREADGKVYRTFEVDSIVSVGSGDKAPETPVATRSIQEPTIDHSEDDLPF